jgi:RHS repeat-associated protein
MGTPGTDLTYVYDGWNLIAEINASHSAVQRYMWGVDLSGTLLSAGGVGALLEVSDAASGNHCPIFDGNGNVAALSRGGDGIVSANYEYDPFGQLIRASGVMASGNPFRFSNKYQDEETQLIYYGYRYNNPDTGRWLSKDPMEERGGQNLYGFVINDPIYRVDPLGNYPLVQLSCGCAEMHSISRAWSLAHIVIMSHQYLKCLKGKFGATGAKPAITLVDGQRKLLGPLQVSIECDPRCNRTNAIDIVLAHAKKSTIWICHPEYFREPPEERAKIIAHEFVHLDACGALEHFKRNGVWVNGFVFDSVEDCFLQTLKEIWGGPPYP